MKNKMILLIMMGIMVLSLASAMDCDGTLLGTYKQGDNIQLRQTCDSCTYVTLNSVTYPNSTIFTIATYYSKPVVTYYYEDGIKKELITYPYTKMEEGVELGSEVDVLRQAVYELNERVKYLEANCILK